MPEQLLRRKAYVSSFNRTTLMPNWVAWKLTAAHTDGDIQRKGVKFHPDDDVPEPYRVTTYDYMQSGYDRGHMCPAADNRWDRRAMDECFLMTNMCPQNHGLNAGDWNEMEMQCRRWAKEYGEVYIVAGPILYRGKHATIGQEHRVTVPEAFFKVVLCLKGTPKAIGFIYRNTDGNRPKGDYVNSIDEVERITGYDFFHGLNKKVQDKVYRSHRGYRSYRDYRGYRSHDFHKTLYVKDEKDFHALGCHPVGSAHAGRQQRPAAKARRRSDGRPDALGLPLLLLPTVWA